MKKDKTWQIWNKKKKIKNQYEFSKFFSNCLYHHHYCCCSNKQSFKNETLSFTSFENLLILFAVAFIFYCQAIVVKLMFNFHQIDLFSKSTPFFYISNTLFSLNIFSTIRYIMIMLAFESFETLYFDEHNITKFLKRFEKQCDEYEVIDEKCWIKLFYYCVVVEWILHSL